MYAQVVESSLKVSIIDGDHMETGIITERPGELMECVRRETIRLPDRKAVPLFRDTFLLGAAAHICVDG
jgi:hypothetical protein